MIASDENSTAYENKCVKFFELNKATTCKAWRFKSAGWGCEKWEK